MGVIKMNEVDYSQNAFGGETRSIYPKQTFYSQDTNNNSICFMWIEGKNWLPAI